MLKKYGYYKLFFFPCLKYSGNLNSDHNLNVDSHDPVSNNLQVLIKSRLIIASKMKNVRAYTSWQSAQSGLLWTQDYVYQAGALYPPSLSIIDFYTSESYGGRLIPRVI